MKTNETFLHIPDRSIYQTPRRVLLMVAELHRRGYERLRVFPFEDQWMAWRCLVKSSVEADRNDLADSPYHICVYMPEPFGWTDARSDSVADLADKFIERYPKACKAGFGHDSAYVQWYENMLASTEPDGLIIELADRPLPTDYLVTCNMDEAVRVPLPPG
jgi:hypothetical protein